MIMAEPSSRYRLKETHHSNTRHEIIYSMAGDVVMAHHSEAGHGGLLIFYIDAKGERFCCQASILEEVPATTPLKKQFVPLKNRLL